MKALFIGGTGTISAAITELAVRQGIELTLLNRGRTACELSGNVRVIHADINEEEEASKALKDESFDVVANFISFTPGQARRDIRLFSGRTDQYIYISSASAYQKPCSHYLISESTPLSNPYWTYSQNKIISENILLDEYRKSGFPVTIVRPSHTYGRTKIPVAVDGRNGGWPVVSRIMRGKPVIIHGDGLSLWTFTHNTDFARAFLGLMGNFHAIGEAVQITSDETLTWNQAYEIIGRHIGKAPEIVHMSVDFLAASNPEYRASLTGDKANSVVFDNSKIKRLVPGFHADVRFDQGVGESIRYILAHPEYQKEDPGFDVWCDRMIDIYRRAMQEASQIKM
ncbi:SDR family oxidoreductase [Ruminococcus sp. CLA-AA-H200]|uniref:SDR family oxidoreductase n=1 Tax=Ruminococcus turbiniformis TaxID=2881258 RepID=A0ABS8FVI3_9FIRM|nr:SDR family oxidoreductase [Ruminococcus turbiniformis]MCC2253988.1 SDR family oxidoreductase [Ruminococcus turbiniformis]